MAENTVIDPVCGAKLEASRTRIFSDYEGMRYYFCSDECRHRFDHDPEAYLQSDLIATNKSE